LTPAAASGRMLVHAGWTGIQSRALDAQKDRKMAKQTKQAAAVETTGPRFTFSAAVSPEAKKAETAGTQPPQAYIFIGRDRFMEGTRDPQEWRKLFLCLARSARNPDGTPMSQNVFGLSIVYDALEKLDELAREGLGDQYESTMKAHWDAIVKEETEKKARKATKAEAEAAEEVKLAETKAAEQPAKSKK
jgi:hypothetical protein